VLRWPLSARSFFRDPIGYVSAHGKDQAVLELAAGRSRFLILRDPHDAWRVLVTDAASFRPGKWKRRLCRFVGDTLNALEGEDHRRRRLLLQPAFDRRRIAQFELSIAAHVERTQAAWENGARIRLRDKLDQLSVAVAGEVLLSGELGGELAPLLATVMANVPRLTPPLRGTPQAQALRKVEKAVSALIAERRHSGGPDDDLVATLCRSGLPERTIRGEVIAALLAIVAEPPSALEATWYLLGQNPAAEERLVAGLDNGRLDYLDAVIRETLRRFPPARHIDRLPAGEGRTNVIVSPLVTHHDPRLYAAPLEFVPERWLEPEDRPRGAYLPFGAGAHACIGEPLARAIMRQALSGIVPRWRLHVDREASAPGPNGPRLFVTLARR
jgi:cytochrome P450